MDYPKTKIYNDGSHYIGIPQGAYPSGKGCKRRAVKQVQQPKTAESLNTFETAYKESQSLPKRERKAHIKAALKTDFADSDELTAFVNKHVERKKTNALKRRTRLMRKLRLQQWDYFCTFTYSDELHTEESFRKKLSNTLKHLVARNGWKYVGVWERSPEKNRLHFHGIFQTPKMIGTLEKVKDYDTKKTPYANDLSKQPFPKTFRAKRL